MRPVLLVGLLAFALSGCLLDRSGLGEAGGDGGPGEDGGPGMDGGGVDAGPETDAGPMGDAIAGDGGGIDAGEDGGPPADAGPPDPCSHRGRRRQLREITSSTFETGTRVDTVVEGTSLVLPVQTYLHGVTEWTGYDGLQVDGTTPTFGDLAAATPGYSSPRADLDYSSANRPANLGISTDGNFSIGVSGELWLAEGTNTFVLEGDDLMGVEIDAPGGTVYRATSYLEDGAELVATVPAGGAGFYPLRIGMQDSIGTGTLQVFRRDGTGPVAITPDELRVDFADRQGRIAIGYDIQPAGTTAPAGLRIWEDDTRDDFSAVAPAGVGITARDNFTLRFLGMMRFPSSNPTIAVTAEKRFHLWVDGVYLGDGDAAGSFAPGIGPGWHEVVFELVEDGGNNGDYELLRDGDVFPLADQRARTRAGGFAGGAGDAVDANVNAGTTGASATLPVSLPAGLETLFAEVSVVVSTADPRDVTVSWTGPAGTGSAPLTDHAHRVGGTERWVFRYPVDATAAIGDWTVSVTNAGSSTLRYERAGVLVHVGGVRDAYPRSGTWTSDAFDFGANHTIDRVSWLASVPGGAGVSARIRVAEAAAELGAATYVDVGASGAPASPLNGRFAQLELTLTGDGLVTPDVRRVRIEGRPCAACGAATDDCLPFGDPDLVALYPFDGSGAVVDDVAGVDPPLDLTISDTAQVARGTSSLSFRGAAIVEGVADATRLETACQTSGEASLEVWFTPAANDPPATAPGRLVTVSTDHNDQGLLLGQNASGQIEGRVGSSSGGGVQLTTATGAISVGALHYAVVTRASDGSAALYLDGVEVDTGTAAGDLSSWLATYRVAMGQERTRTDRHWNGSLHLVAILDRALTGAEVEARWELGPDGGH